MRESGTTLAIILVGIPHCAPEQYCRNDLCTFRKCYFDMRNVLFRNKWTTLGCILAYKALGLENYPESSRYGSVAPPAVSVPNNLRSEEISRAPKTATWGKSVREVAVWKIISEMRRSDYHIGQVYQIHDLRYSLNAFPDEILPEF